VVAVWLLSLRPSADQIDGDHGQDGFVFLVEDADSGPHDFAVGFRLRCARFYDLEARRQNIVGADRADPAQLANAGRCQARGIIELVRGENPHHEGGRVPAGGDKPSERAGTRLGDVGVDHLRVTTVLRTKTVGHLESRTRH
jgi:hypothetical protein